MFTIAGAKKKLSGEMRETPKLKIVTSEIPAAKASGSEPTLFDNDIDIDGESQAAPPVMNTEKQAALKSLTSQLLELREMLKTDQTSEAAERLRSQ